MTGSTISEIGLKPLQSKQEGETMKIKYQLVLLGPAMENWRDEVVDEVRLRFSEIGLSLDEHCEVLEGAGKAPEWEGFPVAVWFGDKTAEHATEVEIAQAFIDRGFSIFPVVDDLQGYKEKTPKLLHPINGQEFDATRLSRDIMTGFRLVRKHRQVFISYKRDESRSVANQLFHELVGRGFRVFLDTVSVDAGSNFQNTLWSRMADVDILVLIDSPNALSSKWVHQEVVRAGVLGMGVVQLIWPNHKRTSGTDFSEPIQLELANFQRQAADEKDVLLDDVLRNVVDAIESQRIRSLNSRRTRLVEGLLSSPRATDVTLFVHPGRHVDVMRGDDKLAEIIPFVGVPDSLSLYEHECLKAHDQTCVVYNGLGVDEQWSAHLKWLNEKAKVEVFQIDDFGGYMEKII